MSDHKFRLGQSVHCTLPFDRRATTMVYNALAIPASLERAETEALGAHAGERTQAHYNTLDFAKGYDWDGIKWERDTRVKTRLAEETITLRLARMERGRIVPWMPIEDGDLPSAWALSEVGLRRSRCSGSQNSPDVEKLIREGQRGWSLSEKEFPVVLLSPIDELNWQGTVQDKNGNSVTVSYSSSVGFRFGGTGS